MSKKIHKQNWTNEEWEQAANRLARSAAPEIYYCKKCGAPVLDGYCCTYCGDEDPHSKD
jgi:hypothetical protein